LAVVAVVVVVFLLLYRGIPRMSASQIWSGSGVGIILVILGALSTWSEGDSIGDALLLRGTLVLGQQIVPIGYGVLIFAGLVAIKAHGKATGSASAGTDGNLSESPPQKTNRYRVSLTFVIVLALISIIIFLVSTFS